MIEPTDEMVQLALDIFLATPADNIASIDAGMSNALAAVLALVERDYSVFAHCEEPHPTEPTVCELARGHKGGHTATVERALDWPSTGTEIRAMACEHCERDILPGDTYALVPGSGGLVQCGEHAANLGEIRVRGVEGSGS